MNVIAFLRAAALAGAGTSLGCVAYITLSPIEARPVIASLGVEHVAAFTVIGGLFGIAAPKRFFTAFAMVIAAATCLEAAQHLVPGRHGRVIDLALKIIGTGIGFGGAAIFNALSAKMSARGSETRTYSRDTA